MRSILVWFGLCAPLAAAPVPAPAPAPGKAAREQLHAEALNYGQQLLNVSTQVSLNYVRTVSRADLLAAALAGLHQAASVPIPSNLTADVKRLADDGALVDFLVQTREKLGTRAELAEPRALLESCRAMMKVLDPYSAVVTDDDRKGQPWGDQPAGFGFELADNVGVGPLRIARVLPGTPAQRAGLRSGDVVSHFDDKPLKGFSSTQAAGLLQRPERPVTAALIDDPAGLEEFEAPQQVALTVLRQGEKPRRITLEHQADKPESVFGIQRNNDNRWEYLIDRQNNVAHVRLGPLNRGAARELGDLLARLKEDGVRGLVLDLRWCPGGFLDEAIGVAGLFLDEVVVARVRGRDEKPNDYHNTQPVRHTKLPLVVLVNAQTSGGAELIAAALQDHKRAPIAGQRTFGKASVQTALYLNVPGASVKLTTGEFLRPGGKNLHRRPDAGPRDDWGVRPDPKLEMRVSPERDRELKGWWEQQTLRPGPELKILPLDDPANDPQRQIALRGVLEQLKR